MGNPLGTISKYASKLPSVKLLQGKNPLAGATDALGLTHAAPPNPADSADAARARALADYYQKAGTVGGVAPVVAPVRLDTANADQARAAQLRNIGDLESVAGGAPTAADAMLTRGTDAAAARARGIAAAYSRANPGAALRMGLGAADTVQREATAQAAEQKMAEQAAARAALTGATGNVRTADLATARADQDAANEAQKLNQSADLQQQQLNNQRFLGTGELATKNTAAPLQAQSDYAKTLVEQNKANQQGTGSFFSGAGSLLTMLSDKDAKTGMRARAIADELGSKVHGVEFTYKPNEGDGRKHVGVVAQEVERAIPGVVDRGGDGRKRLDVGQLTAANTSAIAEIARRLRKIEGDDDEESAA